MSGRGYPPPAELRPRRGSNGGGSRFQLLCRRFQIRRRLFGALRRNFSVLLLAVVDRRRGMADGLRQMIFGQSETRHKQGSDIQPRRKRKNTTTQFMALPSSVLLTGM
jgi:hypothetical protein